VNSVAGDEVSHKVTRYAFKHNQGSHRTWWSVCLGAKTFETVSPRLLKKQWITSLWTLSRVPYRSMLRGRLSPNFGLFTNRSRPRYIIGFVLLCYANWMQLRR